MARPVSPTSPVDAAHRSSGRPRRQPRAGPRCLTAAPPRP